VLAIPAIVRGGIPAPVASAALGTLVILVALLVVSKDAF